VIDATDRNLIPSVVAALAEGEISDRSAQGADNVVGWDGYVFDAETQMYAVRHRTYVPELGRWVERDPISVGSNVYEYANSSPASLLDSLGLISNHPDDQIRGSMWFVLHYLFGDGEAVRLTSAEVERTMRRTRQLRQILRTIRNDAPPDCDEPSKTQTGSFEIHFILEDPAQGWTDGFKGVEYILNAGTVVVDYECQYAITCKQCSDCRNVATSGFRRCRIRFTIQDRFANPTDIKRPDYEYNRERHVACLAKCDAMVEGRSYSLTSQERRAYRRCKSRCDSENPPSDPYGKPFDMSGSWLFVLVEPIVPQDCQ